MLKRLSTLSLLAFSSVAVAHADTLSGAFAAYGADSFTTSAPYTITFNSGLVTPGTATAGFTPYLTAGNEMITFFPASAGTVSFIPTNVLITIPAALYAPGQTGAVLLSVTGISGGQTETYTLYLQTYNAQEVTGGSCSAIGGQISTCLNVFGSGYFTGTGAVNYTASAATFTFTSQEVSQQNAITSFSASTNAIPAITTTTPEPSSLFLLGTGLVGLAGVARRKFKA